MEPLRARNFDSPGTLEYVLGKAGLYQAARDGAEPTDRLKKIFPGRTAPPEETLVPVLMLIVDLADRLGALDRQGEKSRIGEALQRLGVTHKHGAIGQLYHDIRQATEQAARDVAARPPFLCGTPAMIERFAYLKFRVLKNAPEDAECPGKTANMTISLKSLIRFPRNRLASFLA